MNITEIAAHNVVRRSRDPIPHAPEVAAAFSESWNSRVLRLRLHCPETQTALEAFWRWVLDSSAEVEAVCVFGSIVSRSTWRYSISFPKSGGEYVPQTAWVGPSDVDAIVITRGYVPPIPNYCVTRRRYTPRGAVIEEGQIDLLAGIECVAEGELEDWLARDLRLVPLRWRMLTCGGIWVPQEKSFARRVDSACRAALSSPEPLENLAAAFARRRTDAHLSFLRQCIDAGIERGALYGTGWSPPAEI